MQMDRDDLREELLTALAAHRELDGSVDEELVAALLEKIAPGTSPDWSSRPAPKFLTPEPGAGSEVTSLW